MGKKRKKKGKSSPKGKHSSSLAEQLARVKLGGEEPQPPEREAPFGQAHAVEQVVEPLDPVGEAALHQSPGHRGKAQQTELADYEMLALWEAEDADDAPRDVAERSEEPIYSGASTERSELRRALEATRDEVAEVQQENRRLRERIASLSSLRTTLTSLEQKLQAHEAAQEAAVQAAVAAAEEASSRREKRALQERDDARQALADERAAHVSVPLADAMLRRGLPAHTHPRALAALAQSQPQALLPLLQAPPDALQALLEQHVALCCQHERCVEEFKHTSSRVLLTVADEGLCENCQGSDNRRAFRRMVRMCRERRIYRMIVVGGSPDAHTELERLTPDGFLQRIVTGKERRNKKQATEDLRHADLLVVWGPTILPHKISELYTKQKEDYPNKVALVLKRGVASFAREVCDFLEELDGTP